MEGNNTHVILIYLTNVFLERTNLSAYLQKALVNSSFYSVSFCLLFLYFKNKIWDVNKDVHFLFSFHLFIATENESPSSSISDF